jgi:hypothetical protein
LPRLRNKQSVLPIAFEIRKNLPILRFLCPCPKGAEFDSPEHEVHQQLGLGRLLVSTQHFIRHDDFGDTLTISEKLLNDDQDLIHKASGWMLREVGKKAKAVLEAFLDQHGTVMPRTMLRYAIEHFSPDQRRGYLQRKQSSSEGTTGGIR